MSDLDGRVQEVSGSNPLSSMPSKCALLCGKRAVGAMGWVSPWWPSRPRGLTQLRPVSAALLIEPCLRLPEIARIVADRPRGDVIPSRSRHPCLIAESAVGVTAESCGTLCPDWSAAAE
jgi:hypothetical protein